MGGIFSEDYWKRRVWAKDAGKVINTVGASAVAGAVVCLVAPPAGVALLPAVAKGAVAGGQKGFVLGIAGLVDEERRRS